MNRSTPPPSSPWPSTPPHRSSASRGRAERSRTRCASSPTPRAISTRPTRSPRVRPISTSAGRRSAPTAVYFHDQEDTGQVLNPVGPVTATAATLFDTPVAGTVGRRRRGGHGGTRESARDRRGARWRPGVPADLAGRVRRDPVPRLFPRHDRGRPGERLLPRRDHVQRPARRGRELHPRDDVRPFLRPAGERRRQRERSGLPVRPERRRRHAGQCRHLRLLELRKSAADRERPLPGDVPAPRGPSASSSTASRGTSRSSQSTQFSRITVDVGNTLHAYLEILTPGFSVASSSGHDYVSAPEPGVGALTASALLALAGRARRRGARPE